MEDLGGVDGAQAVRQFGRLALIGPAPELCEMVLLLQIGQHDAGQPVPGPQIGARRRGRHALGGAVRLRSQPVSQQCGSPAPDNVPLPAPELRPLQDELPDASQP